MRILWVSVLIVVLDQATKVAVVRTMHRGESIPIVGDWLRFTFTENPGMAFGLQIFSRQSMAVLAIVVTVLLLWYLFSVRGGYAPYLVSLALVLGGAVGNVIDRTLYGLLLGYGGALQGKVVDFIHVDVWRGYLPEALPFVGGAYLPLFPIWNVADMSIVVGVVGILVFQRRFHRLAFEEPARDRERLRELEQQSQASSSEATSAGATLAEAASSSNRTLDASAADVPARAPAAEQSGPALEAAAATDDDEAAEDDRDGFAPPSGGKPKAGGPPTPEADEQNRSANEEAA